jgi:hypothetical protein
MNIHQLSISHDERQDRLLLRLNTLAGEEYRFWLTRRMVILILPALTQMLARLEAAQPGLAASDAPAQHLLTDLKRNAFMQNADFSTPYTAEALQLPLGEAPLFITDAQLNLQSHHSLEIIFQQKLEGAQLACTLNLHAPLVHGLIHLIQQTASKADWALATGIDPAASPEQHGEASDPVPAPRPLMH